ncbi:MAG: polyphosphate polymerase domain-containing protein [Lachnospiraceae bacterium]|nr:polyphosphate polymerase domain-containing protein [Lachnospiraceae bacterium]
METKKNRKFRYENKYIVNVAEIELLRNRILGICDMDKYAIGDGEYNIRSLYFDNYGSSSFYDNEIGIEPREKFRIRIYNCNSDVVVLERKIKVGGKISKDRAVIDKAFAEAIMAEDLNHIRYDETNQLINHFMLKYQTEYLRPRIIVDYVREAYVSELEDIRITFDKEISFSDQINHFFDKDLFLQPIMQIGKELMEVKYTEMLPDYIHSSLNLGKLQQSTFSKYYLSEKMRREGVI